jgi:sigma-B regulation protein RsbU (phosphoserine phosphatase)
VHVLAEEPGNLGSFTSRLNKATCANCPSNRFVTFFFCVVNAATGDTVFANAGHNPPIVMRASGDTELLENGGPPLGIVAMAPYAEQRINLSRGDLLVLYSDGVTEANNADYDEFGEERFIEVLRRNRLQPAEAIAEAVTNALTAFAAGAPPADDITLVVAKRL